MELTVDTSFEILRYMYTVSTGLALATCQMFDEDGTPLVL
jgi:hypothetical protein